MDPSGREAPPQVHTVAKIVISPRILQRTRHSREIRNCFGWPAKGSLLELQSSVLACRTKCLCE